jgi:hypothetical protein
MFSSARDKDLDARALAASPRVDMMHPSQAGAVPHLLPPEVATYDTMVQRAGAPKGAKLYQNPMPVFRHFFPLRNGKSGPVASMQQRIEEQDKQRRHDQAYNAVHAQNFSTSPPSGQKAATRFASTTHSLYKKHSSAHRNRAVETLSEQKTSPKLVNKSTIGYYFREKRTSMKGFSEYSGSGTMG